MENVVIFPDPDLAKDAETMSGEPVTDLVARARNGDKKAWDALVERFAPLIWSICRRHQLGATRHSG